jgi:phytoene dehydrogenase-like protein
MMADYDVLVVGGGHNGLVTAAYLAKSGVRTLVLERNEATGGALASARLGDAIVPTVAANVGRLLPQIVTDLDLARHGLELLAPPARLVSLQAEGPPVTLWADAQRTGVELQEISMADSAAYEGFDGVVRTIAGVVAGLNATVPPDLKEPGLADATSALRLARVFRKLEPRARQTLLRVLPMAVADFVAEHFATDAVRAAVAVRGVLYTAMGPWSAGTTAVLVNDSAGNDGGAAGAVAWARGGPGALAAALSSGARSAGAQIRTGCEVVTIKTDDDGRASGVVLAGGEEITARVVASGLNPKTTLLDLVDPVVAGPRLMWRAGNIRMPGTVGKVNLVLSGRPRFATVTEPAALTGRIVIAPGIDYLERAHDAAKYGRTAESPLIEISIPSLTDETLAPEGRHVASVVVQYAPYHRRDGDWSADRENLGDFVLKTVEDHAPGITDLVESRQVLTPLDLESEYGFVEGHPLHGEPGLDQFFAWRPMLGHARYRFGVEGLYLCGAGAHPGGGITGGPGLNAARVIMRDLKRRRQGN